MASLLSTNPILIPFVSLFLIGLIILALAPMAYMARKRKHVILPTDVIKYNSREMLMLFIGIVLAITGIFAIGVIFDKYGYDVVNTNEDGTKNIEHIGPKR